MASFHWFFSPENVKPASPYEGCAPRRRTALVQKIRIACSACTCDLLALLPELVALNLKQQVQTFNRLRIAYPCP